MDQSSNSAKKTRSFTVHSLKKRLFNLYVKNFYRLEESLDDLLLVDWEKISDKNDFSRLLKGKKKGKLDNKVINKIFPHLKDGWHKIFDEYIELYGLPEAFVDKQEKLISAYKYKLMYLKTGKQHYITLSEAVLSTIEDNSAEKRSFGDLISATAISVGFRLPKREMSAKEFFDLEKTVSK